MALSITPHTKCIYAAWMSVAMSVGLMMSPKTNSLRSFRRFSGVSGSPNNLTIFWMTGAKHHWPIGFRQVKMTWPTTLMQVAKDRHKTCRKADRHWKTLVVLSKKQTHYAYRLKYCSFVVAVGQNLISRTKLFVNGKLGIERPSFHFRFRIIKFRLIFSYFWCAMHIISQFYAMQKLEVDAPPGISFNLN